MRVGHSTHCRILPQLFNLEFSSPRLELEAAPTLSIGGSSAARFISGNCPWVWFSKICWAWVFIILVSVSKWPLERWCLSISCFVKQEKGGVHTLHSYLLIFSCFIFLWRLRLLLGEKIVKHCRLIIERIIVLENWLLVAYLGSPHLKLHRSHSSLIFLCLALMCKSKCCFLSPS